jgi:hypothetical protein
LLLSLLVGCGGDISGDSTLPDASLDDASSDAPVTYTGSL